MSAHNPPDISGESLLIPPRFGRELREGFRRYRAFTERTGTAPGAREQAEAAACGFAQLALGAMMKEASGPDDVLAVLRGFGLGIAAAFFAHQPTTRHTAIALIQAEIAKGAAHLAQFDSTEGEA